MSKSLSPARERLKAALDARGAAQKDLEIAQSRIDRLQAVVGRVAPAQAALAAYDADQAQRMAAWALSADGADAPKADAAKRALLVSAFEDAQAQAAAAQAAMVALHAAAVPAAERAGSASREVWIESKICILEEAEKLLPEMVAAIAHAEELRLKLDAARAVAFDRLDSYDDANRRALAAMARFNAARRDAESRPRESEVNEHHAGWKMFADKLLHSADVTIEDSEAAEIALPRPPMSDFDPVTAAARAAEAFETSSIMRA